MLGFELSNQSVLAIEARAGATIFIRIVNPKMPYLGDVVSR
jgi:hypothetical protein